MTKEDYKRVSTAIWQAGFIKDKNKIKQQAKTEITRLIISGIIGGFINHDPKFNDKEFIKDCGF